MAVWALAVLAGALALPASAPPPETELGRVQVQGESAIAREKKTLAQLFKAETLFEKFHALAPAAPLKIRVYARTRAEQAAQLDLALVTPAGRLPVPLDEEDRFVIDPAWHALDPRTEVRSRLPDGRVTWRPDIRTPGLPPGERRLGDLRLQCRVGFDSGVARGLVGLARLLSFAFDECDDPEWSPSNFADRPVFAVTLMHGERWLSVSAGLLHGLRDGGGQDYDWGFALRERMFRVPLGDASWPDDTRVLLEAMDDPPAPPEPGLRELHDDWVHAALALAPGLTVADVEARVGRADDDTRFDSGRRLLRHLHVTTQRAGPQRLELVSLFGADGRLQKSTLRRLGRDQRY
ncbi:DUF4314 domain-containing protein [Pelomonas sp. P7]|uniref:DUF4314 domain-containing protein n=1 Tax=Pelomonas caseinilytica TaxID=2906763 RepID=A0ABS8XQD4_9BURK|nr:DUF4314 domain-containing protein [Pelomonas sp. P7]MCE4539430.1 DUF4314 domain-containing protein [Pelomonas sp. P7]